MKQSNKQGCDTLNTTVKEERVPFITFVGSTRLGMRLEASHIVFRGTLSLPKSGKETERDESQDELISHRFLD